VASAPSRTAVREILETVAGISAFQDSLNFNDALLVALQRDGGIGDVASFDSGFDSVPTLVRRS